jgi:hypothetical protein
MISTKSRRLTVGLALAAGLALLVSPRAADARIGFAVATSGACKERAFTSSVSWPNEGDPIWLRAFTLRGVHPMSKGALKIIVQHEFRKLFDTLVDRYVWTNTQPMRVTLTGDLSYSFTMDPADKAQSVAGVMEYLKQNDVGYNVTHEIFRAVNRYNIHLERMHGVVGIGRCTEADHRLEINVDL